MLCEIEFTKCKYKKYSGSLPTHYNTQGPAVWSRVSIIPSKNNSGGILIGRNSLFNGILRNFTQFRSLIPEESKNSVLFRRNSAGHSSVE